MVSHVPDAFRAPEQTDMAGVRLLIEARWIPGIGASSS
jgi:hypothetical protein